MVKSAKALEEIVTAAAAGIAGRSALKLALPSRGLRAPLRFPSWVPGGIPARLSLLLSVALALVTPNATAGGRPPLLPRRGPASSPPWSGSGGYPPPHPLDPARASARTVERGARDHGLPPRSSPVHPAVHARRRSGVEAPTPLFPPAQAGGSNVDDVHHDRRVSADPQRRAAMARHPAGRSAPPFRNYVVRHGDTLWDIAQRVLKTEDRSAIARYWPRIHRLNLAVIGANPNLIRPGQVLALPERES